MSTEYRQLVKKKLVDKEISLLPQTMPLSEMVLHKECLEQKVVELNNRIRELYDERENLYSEINFCKQKINNKEILQKSDVVSCCPKEGCRGFISRIKWTCGICATHVCKKCLEIHSEEDKLDHECKAENIESAKLIMKECKTCPKCAIPIFKIEGCDQMFCVQCATAFSWSTGKIETGRIHNPHYYQWVRQNNNGVVPRETQDDGCNPNNLINFRVLYARFYPTPESSTIFDLHREVTHIQSVTLRELTPTIDNTDLRILYLLNRTSKEDFEEKIVSRNRIAERHRAVYNCLDLYVNVMIGLFTELYETSKITHFLQEEHRIRNFTNESLYTVGKNLNFRTKRYQLALKITTL